MTDTYEDYEARVRHRAYAIWQSEGEPEGRADAHWALAREQVSTEENLAETLKDPDAGPAAEPLLAVDGMADLPGRLSDQGERQDYPSSSANRGKADAA